MKNLIYTFLISIAFISCKPNSNQNYEADFDSDITTNQNKIAND